MRGISRTGDHHQIGKGSNIDILGGKNTQADIACFIS